MQSVREAIYNSGDILYYSTKLPYVMDFVDFVFAFHTSRVTLV